MELSTDFLYVFFMFYVLSSLARNQTAIFKMRSDLYLLIFFFQVSINRRCVDSYTPHVIALQMNIGFNPSYFFLQMRRQNEIPHPPNGSNIGGFFLHVDIFF